MRGCFGHRSAASLCVLLLVVASVAGCGEPLATPETVRLQATGSTTMGPLVEDLAASFAEQSPSISIDVSAFGTQMGLDALSRGEADIALASWLPSELDPDWQATAIARDGIAIVVHPGNSLEGLGLLQIRDLFSGRADRWALVGGRASLGQVQPVSREEGSGTRAAFEALVMEGLRVTPRAILAPSGQAVVEYVAQHADAIGYVSMADLSSQVRVLAIEGERPTPETAGQGSYPLTRELWLVTAKTPSAAVQQFVEFTQSPAGQQIAGRRYGRIR